MLCLDRKNKVENLWESLHKQIQIKYKQKIFTFLSREVAIILLATTYFFVQMFDKPGFLLQEKRVKMIFPENACGLPSHSQYNDKTHEALGRDTPHQTGAACSHTSGRNNQTYFLVVDIGHLLTSRWWISSLKLKIYHRCFTVVRYVNEWKPSEYS